MPRAKGGPKTRRRHKKTMKLAKGYVGGRRKTYRQARETVERGLTYAYRDRKQRKRDLRDNQSTLEAISRSCAGPARALFEPVVEIGAGSRERGRQPEHDASSQ